MTENLKKKFYHKFYLCFSACDGNMYGANCTKKCGTCLRSKQCDHINGTCINGCDRGFHGSECIEGNIV